VKIDEIDFPGGERGIRTLGAAFGSTHDFQSCSFSQLGHLSWILIKSKYHWLLAFSHWHYGLIDISE
jgi:hypothetical protein